MSRARRSRPFRAIPRPIVGHVLPPELRAPHVADVAATLPRGVRDPGFEILLRRIDTEANEEADRMDDARRLMEWSGGILRSFAKEGI